MKRVDTTRFLALAGLMVAAITTRAAGATSLCPGDCDGDRAVTIDELTLGVSQTLASPPSGTCVAFDRDGDGQVVVADLIAAVGAALEGCPPSPVPFTAALDPSGPALIITPTEALLPKAVYALSLTSAVKDAAGRSLQASATFRDLKGSTEGAGDGPIALFDVDPESSGNPYPDPRLVEEDHVRIPDRFALRGLDDTSELAPARAIVRATADAIGASGLFSTTAPIRIPLSNPVDIETVTQESVRLFARSDGRLDLPPLLHLLARTGVRAADVALAFSFPTTAVEDDLLAVRARLDELRAADALRVVLDDPDPDDAVDLGVFDRGSPGPLADFFADNPDVATVVHGLLPSPDFRGPDKLFDAAKVAGTMVVTPTLLDFYLTLPAGSEPHHVVIVQHGFGGNDSIALTVANELAREGLAGIAINAVSHGDRGSPLDLLSPNPLQLRDVLRQTVADQLAVVRAIQTGIDVDGDRNSEVDPAGIGYLGISLGGIVGGTFIALEPSLQMAVLNVAGGRVAFLGDNPGTRPIYTDFLATQAQLDVASSEFEVFLQRMLELGQQGLDTADPLDYARRWRREPFAGFVPRRVLMQEGIGDALVSNASTEALAAAGGLVAGQAQSDPNGVSGLWRFDPPGGHGIFSRPDVRAQAFRFLASGGTEIIDQ